MAHDEIGSTFSLSKFHRKKCELNVAPGCGERYLLFVFEGRSPPGEVYRLVHVHAKLSSANVFRSSYPIVPDGQLKSVT